MKNVTNKFLLAENKFVPEVYLKQPGLMYRCIVLVGSSQMTKQEQKKIKRPGDSRYIYKNEIDKICLQHDMTNGDFKYFLRKTASNKVWPDKAFEIVIGQRVRVNGLQTF